MLGMQIFEIGECDRKEREEFFFLRDMEIEDGSFDDLENVRLKALITKLSPIMQKIVWLRFWQNFKTEAIAEILGCSEEDIRGLLEKVFDELRYELIMAKHPIH